MKSVLIVDDDPLMLNVYRVVVGSCGEYELTTACSPDEAREYKDREFDVLVLDGLNGDCFDLYDELNAGRKMIVSGSLEMCDRAKENGIEAHMKPVFLPEILKK